jgi:Spy/CpxP family protein refolding chaperone
MQFVRKTLFATAMAVSLIAHAHAATTVQTLDITWYKDGKVIDKGQHIVNDGTSLATYLHRGGKDRA